MTYRFSGFSVDPVRRLLFGPDGVPITLKPRVFDTLIYLIEHRGKLLEKRDLLEAIWPHVVVEENNLNQAISTLRRVFAERRDDHRFIVTEPGRGYRFVADVSLAPRPAAEEDVKVAVRQPDPDVGRADTDRVRWRLAATGLAGIAIVIALAYFASRTVWTSAPSAGARASSSRAAIANSIAVLPCENLSPRPEHEFFAVGIHLEIVDRLANISALNVFSPESAARFGSNNASMADTGRELPVESIVTCSVLYTGSSLQIVAQRLDPTSGKVLWSNRYQGDAADALAFQTVLATDLAEELEVSLSAHDLTDIERVSTQSTEAYALYLQARVSVYLQARGSGVLDETIDSLDRAIDIDPNFAAAYGLRAVAYALNLVNNRFLLPVGERASFEKNARDNVERALSLDPTEAWAWNARTLVYTFSWRWADARRAHETLRELRPNDPNANIGYGWFEAFAGDYKAAEQLERERLQRDRSPRAYYSLGWVLVYAGEGEAAVRAFHQAISMAPDYVGAFMGLAVAEAQRGRRAEATSAVRTAEELMKEWSPYNNISALIWTFGALGLRDDAIRHFGTLERWATEYEIGAGNWAAAYIGLGRYDEARVWLERAANKADAHEIDLGFYDLMMIKSNPLNDPILTLPPFNELRARIGNFN